MAGGAGQQMPGGSAPMQSGIRAATAGFWRCWLRRADMMGGAQFAQLSTQPDAVPLQQLANNLVSLVERLQHVVPAISGAGCGRSVARFCGA